MEQRRAVFLLSGWSNAGKDTVGKIMLKKYGAQRYAFADRLKEVVAIEQDIPLDWTHTEIGKATSLANGKTVRQMLIQRGQEIRVEKNNPMYFAEYVVEQIISKYESNPKIYTTFCITDWRLPEEFAAIEKILTPHGFQIFKVRVKRVGETNNLVFDSSPVNDFLTETQLDRWIFDAYINNPLNNYYLLEEEVDNMLRPFIYRNN